MKKSKINSSIVEKEVSMNRRNKKVFNVKNLTLNGVHVLLLLVALLGHPVLETKPVGALP